MLHKINLFICRLPFWLLGVRSGRSETDRQ